MQPLALVRTCPACGRLPAVRYKHIFSTTVRMECRCGVAGQWRPWRKLNLEPWNDAAAGWEAAFGKPPLAVPSSGTFRAERGK